MAGDATGARKKSARTFLRRRPAWRRLFLETAALLSTAVSLIIASSARCDLIEIEIEIEIRYITMTIFVHSGAPEREEIPLRQRRPRAAAMTEFDAALTTLGIKQRSAAQWFHTSERNIRRWKSGARRTPPGVMVTVRLMMAGKVGPADVELAAVGSTNPNSTRRSVQPAPVVEAIEPQPLVEPAPADPSQSIGEKILALTPGTCRWPHGDPQHSSFCFCSRPAVAPPYCKAHHIAAHVARSPSSDIKALRRGNQDGARTLAPTGAN